MFPNDFPSTNASTDLTPLESNAHPLTLIVSVVTFKFSSGLSKKLFVSKTALLTFTVLVTVW